MLIITLGINTNIVALNIIRLTRAFSAGTRLATFTGIAAFTTVLVVGFQVDALPIADRIVGNAHRFQAVSRAAAMASIALVFTRPAILWVHGQARACAIALGLPGGTNAASRAAKSAVFAFDIAGPAVRIARR